MGNHGVLSGSAIERFRGEGRICIEPYQKERLNPGSYDLALGRKIAVYKSVTDGDFGKCRPEGITGEMLRPRTCRNPNQPVPGRTFTPNGFLDAAIDNETLTHELEPGEAFFLWPGIGYLMHTEETVWTDMFVPVVDGKSSVGRLFAAAHVTAGYGEANFNGQYTLEVIVTQPLVVYAGMRFCQIRFHTISGLADQYNGNYVGKDAMGPVASKTWKQIQDDGLLEKKT